MQSLGNEVIEGIVGQYEGMKVIQQGMPTRNESDHSICVQSRSYRLTEFIQQTNV